MIKRLVLNAVAEKPVDVTPQIAQRAYELTDMSSEAARTVERLRTGSRRGERYGKMNPRNKQMPKSRLAKDYDGNDSTNSANRTDGKRRVCPN